MLTHVEYLRRWLRLQFEGQRGASMVEYSLLLVLIALICIAAITVLGQSGSSTFDSTGSIIANANGG
jgi:pilus assembly protein Flp/PilA